MHIAEVLRSIREQALSEQEKGRIFEKLIQAWFRANPVYNDLSEVWLWEQFPGREQFGGHDLGIDLVARTRLGEYWAIQCKFYGENTKIGMDEVAAFVGASGRSFKDPVTGEQTQFAARYWISTNDSFNANALQMIQNQIPPVQRLTLEHLEASEVDWEALYNGNPGTKPKKEAFEHQKEAVKKAREHFKNEDRGKLIMACGTGKSLTANLIAQEEVKDGGAILCLVPSISLVNQFLNSWMADTDTPTHAICICSDAKVSRRKGDDLTNAVTDLALPATTDAKEIARRYQAYQKLVEKEGGHIVVFSTYQSIDAVADTQKMLSEAMGKEHSFDLIICDEAHRTTGIVKAQEGRSAFTKIHDNNFIQGKKRLYMTATPRIYADNAKIKAIQSDVELCSMDDEALYGKEIHNVSFAYAIDNKLLTDYKVLVLTVGSEFQLPEELRKDIQNPENKELNFDVASKLVGCINGLAKNTTLPDNAIVWDADPRIMRRAIAFCPNIDKKDDPASSKNTTEILPQIAAKLSVSADENERKIQIQARHIDGSMDAAKRANALAWLAEDNANPDECRVLCNVRCLSEGIDVPALDAAIFLSPRNSQVDVVQSVGRIMRNFRKGEPDEKKYGYIIIPVVVNPKVPPEEALNDNDAFRVVWSVLNALRSHDDRFEAMINSVALNQEKPEIVIVDKPKFYPHSGYEENPDGEREEETNIVAQGRLFEDVDNQIYGKMVEKVGSRLYWERWARNIGPLAQKLIARIGELVEEPGELQDSFRIFVKALQAAINDAVDEKQAMEMLGQHLITRPVFEALFAEYAFDESNAVTGAMNQMLEKLLEHGLAKDTALLEAFYESVKRNLGEVKTLAGKQTVIKNLYDNFFRGAFPLAAEQLGIYYTPVECVDFILRSVDAIIKGEFGIGLTDKDVHILDPFAGTGTFITRLLQSGLIRPEDLRRKYLHELHCNEIMLLPYYVANVNIESVYRDLTDSKEYLRFNGICLTDTFALRAMAAIPSLYPFLAENFRSMEQEQNAPIRVIVGNPPYNMGQKSANDNARNLKYPELDQRIGATYTANSSAQLKNKIYDPYIRAIRWATDRLYQNKEGGVVGFTINSGWLDGKAATGLRRCLAKEFSSIYVFDLKGGINGKGEEQIKKEGESIFNIKTGTCIVFLIYNPTHTGDAKIYYSEIGNYLDREQKLKFLSEASNIFDKKIEWLPITPDSHGDWLNKRTDLFSQFLSIGDKEGKADKEVFFEPIYSLGVSTSRDPWCWNFSPEDLENNIKNAIAFYNKQCAVAEKGENIDRDPKKFKWSPGTLESVEKGKLFDFNHGSIRIGDFRPFCEKYLYFSSELNERTSMLPKLFPAGDSENRVICVGAPKGKKDFFCLMVNKIPDLHILGDTHCFPLYFYKKPKKQGDLLGSDGYTRHDALTDWVLTEIRGRFDNARSITKEMIFYYVYGLLHSPEYRARFNNDLKKELPHIPIVDKVEDFAAFAEAGRKLADLHLNYENLPPCPGVTVTGAEKSDFSVREMKFPRKAKDGDQSRIIYNSEIEISNIPLEAYDYVINGKSAIKWIMECYRVKTDKASGIVSDPNDWAKERNKPRYILDLLLSIINLSLQTLKIVGELPKLEL